MSTEPESTNITDRSGGADLNAQGDNNVTGDVVGRDKIVNIAGDNVAGDKISTIDQSGQQVDHQINVAGDYVAPPLVGIDMLHQLPAPPGDFTGRAAELAELCAQFKQGVTISGVQGQGGVGKTALALCLAAQLVERYPDAQIFLDVKGVSDSPLTADEIMAHVVRSFQPTAKLPDNETELKAAYRSALFNRRVLLLLDNARDAEQINPLLPPSEGCGVIVTSRLHFHVPGLFAQNLEALPKDDACALLLKIAARIGDEAEHIARLCGYLPLMLTIAGGALAERIDLKPASYTRRLEDAKTRLDMVAASFTLSYELLREDFQVTWRMLAAFPNTFEMEGAAAVCGLEREVAEMQLSELVRYSLLEWDAKTERYHLHDLARLFAGSKLSDNDRVAAQRRHAEHYRIVLAAADHFYRQGGGAIVHGLGIFDAEWGNIQAGQAWAANFTETDDDAARLCNANADIGRYCLSLRLHPREWIRWLEAALVAAQQLDDRSSEGAHLGNLGIAYAELGEVRRVINLFEQALTIYAELGEVRRAINLFEQALTIAREISAASYGDAKRMGARREEGTWLGNLGVSYYRLGHVQRAIEFYEQHRDISREIGDRQGEGIVLANLGSAYMALGETQRAIEFFEQALVITRETGDRHWAGMVLGNLGRAAYNLGETRLAINLFEQALVITREMADRRAEGEHLRNLGNAYATLGEMQQAIEYMEAALKIFEELKDPAAEKARRNLSRMRAALSEK
jgi:tetratricopeptide (TPR) repeat protein